MDKSEKLQQWMESAIEDPLLFQRRKRVYTHLLGTAHFAALLAMKRGVDSEMAELAGLLHDISDYLTEIITLMRAKVLFLLCGF